TETAKLAGRRRRDSADVHFCPPRRTVKVPRHQFAVGRIEAADYLAGAERVGRHAGRIIRGWCPDRRLLGPGICGITISPHCGRSGPLYLDIEQEFVDGIISQHWVEIDTTGWRRIAGVAISPGSLCRVIFPSSVKIYRARTVIPAKHQNPQIVLIPDEIDEVYRKRAFCVVGLAVPSPGSFGIGDCLPVPAGCTARRDLAGTNGRIGLSVTVDPQVAAVGRRIASVIENHIVVVVVDNGLRGADYVYWER